MYRFIAQKFAKARYVLNQHVEAESNLLNAGLALRQAAEKRELSALLTKEADEMDARIKEMDEKLDKGFWECENGHEIVTQPPKHIIGKTDNGIDIMGDACPECFKLAKLIKRDQMTGQEKYESDKERTEAEGIAKSKRDQAKAEEENAANSEKTAKYFRDLATNNRTIAEKIRKL